MWLVPARCLTNSCHYFRSGLSSVPSVQQWLKAVRLSVENECLSSLQSKSLTKDPALAAVLAVGDAHGTSPSEFIAYSTVQCLRHP